MPQRNAAVCTGASHSRLVSSSSIDSVTEQPAMSSEVTKLPTSERAISGAGRFQQSADRVVHQIEFRQRRAAETVDQQDGFAAGAGDRDLT